LVGVNKIYGGNKMGLIELTKLPSKRVGYIVDVPSKGYVESIYGNKQFIKRKLKNKFPNMNIK